MRAPNTTEFAQSLAGYVRPSDNGITDTRDATARKMGVIPTHDFIELMAEVPHDVAAIFSGCVRVTDAATIANLSSLKPNKLMETLGLLKSCGTLPLVAESGHPAEAIFSGMVDSAEGCLLYRDVAFLLAWGREEPGMRMHLCGVDRAAVAAKAKAKAEADAELIDADKKEASADGFVDAREDDEDRDDAQTEES